MKKTKILLSAALAATLSLGFVSCSSDNDEPSHVTNETVGTDDETVLSLVNGVYSHWQPLSSSFSFIIELNSNKLISFEGEESEAGPVNSRFEQEPTTWYQVKIFNHLFLGIAQDNEAIATIEKSKKEGKLSEAGYNAAVGKAKFLRALAYLKLAQLWGEVPVFTEQGGSTTERKDLNTVFNQIVSDFTDAEKLLWLRKSGHVHTSYGATTHFLLRRLRLSQMVRRTQSSQRLTAVWKRLWNMQTRLSRAVC